MRRRRVVAVATVVLALGVAQPALGHGKPSSPFAPGNASSLLLSEWWVTGLSRPVSDNPFTGTADPCVTFLAGHVLAPIFPPEGDAQTISCTAHKATWILMVTFSSECSDVEEPPFFGATPRERRACAIAGDDGITTNKVRIDGKEYDVNRFRYQSPDRKVRLPEDDLFGVDADKMRFSADAWAPLLKPLAPGHHVVEVFTAGEFFGSDGPFQFTGTMNLEVTRR